MAQSLEDQIREYRTQASQKQAQRVRAQIELDAAEARVVQAREALQTEFGVTTPDDARVLHDKLTADLAAKQAEIEAAFAEAGA